MARQEPAAPGAGNPLPPIPQMSPGVPPLGGDPIGAQPSGDARNNIRQTNPRAYDVREEAERDIEDVHIPVYGLLEARVYSESIVVASEEELIKDRAERLKFDQDLLTIELDPPNEENAPQQVPVGVNGKFIYLPVGTRIRLPRCFVEVLAVAQPYTVKVKVTERDSENPTNHMTRNPRMRYPFTILHDPSPNGRQWLRRVKQMA